MEHPARERTSMKVAIVLDPNYPELELLIDAMPIWAVDSVNNRAIAKRFWEMRGSADAYQGMTLFSVADERDAESNCICIIGTVDQHHGIDSSGSEVSMLKVIGVKPSPAIQAEMKAYGFVTFEGTSEGFIARSPLQSS
jgi:hypothetical protein